MIDTDLFRFQALMKRVCATFRVRTDDENYKAMTQSYFEALRKWSFDDLERGADAWMETQTKLPKPVEWRMAIPKPKREVPILSKRDAIEYMRAEKLCFEDVPCGCTSCVEAGVQEKPLRFVPEFDGNDCDARVKHPIRDQEVTNGHWAHGWELARWYDTRADFMNRYFELIASIEAEQSQRRKPFAERLAEIFGESVLAMKKEYLPYKDDDDAA